MKPRQIMFRAENNGSRSARGEPPLRLLDKWRMKNMSRLCSPASHAFVLSVARGIRHVRQRRAVRTARRWYFLFICRDESERECILEKSFPRRLNILLLLLTRVGRVRRA